MAAVNVKFCEVRRETNIVKGAVAVDSEISDYMPEGFVVSNTSQMSPRFTIDKTRDTLDELMRSLSTTMNLPLGGSDIYGLMHEKSDPSGRAFTKAYIFVIDLQELRDGFTLNICASPKLYASKMIKKLQSLDIYGKWEPTLDTLFDLTTDTTFAREFHKQNGINVLMNMIMDGAFDSNVKLLCTVLDIFTGLMRHSDVLQYSQLPDLFVVKLASNVNGNSKFENNNSLRLCLSILLTVLDKAPNMVDLIIREIRFESLIRHLEKTQETIVHPVLTLMNYLFKKTDEETRASILKAIHEKPFRDAIFNIIKTEMKKPDERIHDQLLQVQQMMYHRVQGLAERRPTTTEIERITEMAQWNSPQPVHPLSSASADSLHNSDRRSNSSLRVMAPDAKTRFAEFVSLTPPGSLVLDTILGYSSKHAKRLSDIQVECNFPAETWPILLARLVDALAKALSVYPVAESDDYMDRIRPKLLLLVFASEHFFLDYFFSAMELFLQTWREMHASPDDEDKVLNVIKHQLALGVSENTSTFAELKKLMFREFTYFHIQKTFDQQRNEREELKLKSTTIKDLQNHLIPEMEHLVKARKIQLLKEGSIFGRLSKNKSFPQEHQIWFWQLDENERFFSYTERSSKDVGLMPNLKLKTLPLSRIKRIVTGSEFSETLAQQIGTKLSKKLMSASPVHSGFAFELKNDGELLTLTTDDEVLLRCWIDGINMLLGNVDPVLFNAEVHRLLDMEVRVRLLNVLNPPSEPPPIPKLPGDFGWIPEKYRVNMQKKNKKEYCGRIVPDNVHFK